VRRAGVEADLQQELLDNAFADAGRVHRLVPPSKKKLCTSAVIHFQSDLSLFLYVATRIRERERHIIIISLLFIVRASTLIHFLPAFSS
jgi:hypothetical protein